MNPIAFIYGNTVIYWSGVVMTLAVVTGVLFFLSACSRGGETITAAAASCPMAIFLSLLFGRLIHWFYLSDSYESFLSAMTDYTSTGYALSGAFLGCLLTAAILKLTKIETNTPFLLDCMSIGGSAAIALGRLSSLFSTENRGDILEGFWGLPVVWPVLNVTSGEWEYRFATFFFQSVIAGILFFVLWKKARKPHKDGDITLTFLLLYCASQTVLDSTRYDALRLRVNGFISVVQVFSAITLTAVITVISRQWIKNNGRKSRLILSWLVCAAAIGTAAFLEYYIQRHGDQALAGYSMMSGCMLAVAVTGLYLLKHGGKEQGKFIRQ